MRPKFLIFKTDRVLNVGIRLQSSADPDGDRPRIHFRIFDGDRDVHVAEVSPCEPLGQSELLTAWMTDAIKPRQIIKSDSLCRKRLAFPPTDRIPKPRRSGIRGVRGRSEKRICTVMTRRSKTRLLPSAWKCGPLRRTVWLVSTVHQRDGSRCS